MLSRKTFFGSRRVWDSQNPNACLANFHIATNPGDLVLDSFLGSGTTAAVAHKMGRRYIGIELGEHAVTHCVPRLRKVIDGEQGGISQAVGWQGGGGYRFYRLGAAVFDEQGRINPAIRFPHLAAHVWFAETRTPLDLTSFGSTNLGRSELAAPRHPRRRRHLPALQRDSGRPAAGRRQRVDAQGAGRAPAVRWAEGHLRRKLPPVRRDAGRGARHVQTDPV